MLTNLASVLRSAGLAVVEVSGWQTLGHGEMSGVRGIMWHHTGTVATDPGDYPSLNIVRNGRPDLSGPLANLGLGRSGTWYAIAAGRCWHAGAGSYPGIGINNGNDWMIGIEAEHPGISGYPWPTVQMESYRKGAAALVNAYKVNVDKVIAHKEWAPDRKVDPIDFNMPMERGIVNELTKTTPIIQQKFFLLNG